MQRLAGYVLYILGIVVGLAGVTLVRDHAGVGMALIVVGLALMALGALVDTWIRY